MPHKISDNMYEARPQLPETFRIGTTAVYSAALPTETVRAMKREEEKAAVEKLVEKAFGRHATLCHHPSGAPYIDGSNKYISITHGAGYALLAVNGDLPIGIDIEAPRPTLKRISGRFLATSELQTYNSSPEALLDAWTAKEAIFKAIGIPGLTIPEIILPDNLAQGPFAIHGKSVKMHIMRMPEFTIALAETHKI